MMARIATALERVDDRIAGLTESIEAAAARRGEPTSGLGDAIGSTIELDEVLHRTLAAATALPAVDGSAIRVTRRNGSVETAVQGLAADGVAPFLGGPPDGSRFVAGVTSWDVEGADALRTGLVVPLGLDGRGTLSVFSRNKDAFDADAVTILGMIARQAAPAVENAFRFLDVQELAATDLRTGVGSALAFEEALPREISAARRYGRPLSLIQVDLDDFGAINRQFSQEIGNQVLTEFGERIRSTIRGSDAAFRNSGGADEFFLILPDTTREFAKRSLRPTCVRAGSAPLRRGGRRRRCPAAWSSSGPTTRRRRSGTIRSTGQAGQGRQEPVVRRRDIAKDAGRRGDRRGVGFRDDGITSLLVAACRRGVDARRRRWECTFAALSWQTRAAVHAGPPRSERASRRSRIGARRRGREGARGGFAGARSRVARRDTRPRRGSRAMRRGGSVAPRRRRRVDHRRDRRSPGVRRGRARPRDSRPGGQARRGVSRPRRRALVSLPRRKRGHGVDALRRRRPDRVRRGPPRVHHRLRQGRGASRRRSRVPDARGDRAGHSGPRSRRPRQTAARLLRSTTPSPGSPADRCSTRHSPLEVARAQRSGRKLAVDRARRRRSRGGEHAARRSRRPMGSSAEIAAHLRASLRPGDRVFRCGRR